MADKDYNKMVGDRILMYLEEQGKTKCDLAKYLGVSSTSVSNWIYGYKMPRMDKINAMCNYFHIPRAALLDENYIHRVNEFPVRQYENVSAGNAHNNVIGYYAELLIKPLGISEYIRIYQKLSDFRWNFSAFGGQNPAHVEVATMQHLQNSCQIFCQKFAKNRPIWCKKWRDNRPI